MEPTSVVEAPRRFEDELLASLDAAEIAYRHASETTKAAAYDHYCHALDRFTDFVFRGKLPPEGAPCLTGRD